MISALLFAVSLAPMQIGSPDAEPQQSAAKEWIARVTPTRFLAINSTDHPQVLVFGTQRQGALSTIVLQPRGSMDHRFPRGTLDGLDLEVLSLAPEGWRTSGVLSLNELVGLGDQVAWIRRGGSAWVADASGRRTRLVATKSLLPGTALARPGRRGVHFGVALPAHVPVSTPLDRPRGEVPPRLEEEPLPPI